MEFRLGGIDLANIQSQIKRHRQNEKRRLRNRDFRGAARTAVKGALAALAGEGDAPSSVKAATSSLDRAARKGAIHPKNAARRKGRLMKRAAKMAAQAKSPSVATEKSKTTKKAKSSK